MHRYYAHALGAVLTHQPHFSMYAVRHPFPPYATQYLSLLALSKVFSFDSAEKVVACLEILCFAYGLRFCATAIGPAGAWVSLLIAPLLLPWYLLMGFFNYSIGVGLALFAIAFWLRLDRSRWAIPGFALSVLVLIFSHPVPLLLLIAFLSLDLMRRRFLSPRPPGPWLGASRRQIGLLFYTLCLALYPSLAIDKTQTASTLSDFRLHVPFIRTALLLTGLSPYNSRSHALAPNGFRLAAYTLLVLAFCLGFRTLRRDLKLRTLSVGGSFLVYAVVFGLVLPLLPDRLNGGVFFATRMVIMVWIFALLAAAGCGINSLRFRSSCLALGAVFTLLTLLPSELIFRPLAQNVAHMENEVLPSHTQGFLLGSPELTPAMRSTYDIAFNPYLWANVLPLVRQDDVLLDAPWLQLSVSPLRAAPGSAELRDATPLTALGSDRPPLLTTLFPSAQIEHLIQSSNFIVYAGTTRGVEAGLNDYLGSKDAAEFSCRHPQNWALLCTRNSAR